MPKDRPIPGRDAEARGKRRPGEPAAPGALGPKKPPARSEPARSRDAQSIRDMLADSGRAVRGRD